MPITGAISSAGKNKILFYSTNYGGSTFTIPSGVSSINVIALGAAGGASSQQYQGKGAYVTAKIPVTPGETIYYEVGQLGLIGGVVNIAQGGSGSSSQTIGSGSYPNGGAAGPGDGGGFGNTGYKGGGMTALFRTAKWNASGTPLIIAGGGGGAGSNPAAGGYGGNSGQVGLSGGECTNPSHNAKDPSKPGGGATQSAGGALGHQSTYYYSPNQVQPTAGSLYSGGSSGYVTINVYQIYNRAAGGAGGGGYYGGGGGGGDCEYGQSSGGGGGSSYIIPEATNTSYATSNSFGNGAMIVWVD